MADIEEIKTQLTHTAQSMLAAHVYTLASQEAATDTATLMAEGWDGSPNSLAAENQAKVQAAQKLLNRVIGEQTLFMVGLNSYYQSLSGEPLPLPPSPTTNPS